MKRRILGRTGLSVSEIALGTVEIGLDYGIPATDGFQRPSFEEAERLLLRALDIGVNFIDTARAYGEAESIIGRVLAGRRHEFVLCSKVKQGTPEQVIESVHESLRLLRTDAVDLMLIHGGSTEATQGFEIAPVLHDLKGQGKIRFVGASVYGVESALEAVQCGSFDCVQLAYSMLDRRMEEAVIPAARRNNVGVFARSILLKGALTHRVHQLPTELEALKQAIEQLRGALGVSEAAMPEMAYRYALASDIPHALLVGTGSIAELENAVAFANAGPLASDVLSRVRALPMPDPFYLNPGNWPA